jgi:phospholipid/cholesterol/gamma-HCH transport system substrate-binding protein
MTDTRSRTSIVVGIFMLLGLACVGWLAIRLGDLHLFSRNEYQVVAHFTSASGLRQGAYVEAGGVRVGRVVSIHFRPRDYTAEVTMAIEDGVPISDDAIASIRTAGIIGDKFVKITPGGSPERLKPGMEILETEPSINLEELISKYIFEGGKK